jgi:hypothetical protein
VLLFWLLLLVVGSSVVAELAAWSEWARVARRLGWEGPAFLGPGLAMSGSHEGCTVRIERRRLGGGEVATWIEVAHDGRTATYQHRGFIRTAHGIEVALAAAMRTGRPALGAVAGSRYDLLAQLICDAPLGEETKEACRGALTDPDPRARLLAAGHLGQEAIGVVRAIAGDEQAPTDLRLNAIRRLEDSAPDELGSTLGALLASPTARVHAAALRAAARLRWQAALPHLLACLDGDSEAIVPAAIEALTSFDYRSAEPALLRLLAGGSVDVRRAAVIGLGKVGSIGAVEPLLELAGLERKGSGLGALARNAALAIQSRVGGEAGRVALWQDPESGAMSLPEEGGGLEIAKRD